MKATFGPGSSPLNGTVMLPGDKSLSHRAVLFSAMAQGESTVSGLLDSDDVRSTISAVEALGAETDVASAPDGTLAGTIRGWGASGPTQPIQPIDCGNSGTTCRLLLGVLAGWPVSATLIGDESLSRRPMRRVTDPLTSMGARFETSPEGTLPVVSHGSDGLNPVSYDSPVASAQVKTAVLLAGLRARGGVRVTEPAPSRDHTERLLPAFGVAVKVDAKTHAASLCGPVVPKASTVAVPRDPSSAAFIVVAGLTVPGSEITMPEVSLNPTRVGFVHVVERMGADIRILPVSEVAEEPAGEIAVRYTPNLQATMIRAEEVPSLIDEVPVLALLATQAHGTTRFEGVEELRVKESDRLAAVADGLARLGATVRTGSDWLEVDGPTRLHGATLSSLGDHRLAMTWAIAGLIGTASVDIERFDAVDVSYPGFADDLAALRA